MVIWGSILSNWLFGNIVQIGVILIPGNFLVSFPHSRSGPSFSLPFCLFSHLVQNSWERILGTGCLRVTTRVPWNVRFGYKWQKPNPNWLKQLQEYTSPEKSGGLPESRATWFKGSNKMISTVFTSQLYQLLGWLHYKNQGAFLEDWGINAHGGEKKSHRCLLHRLRSNKHILAQWFPNRIIWLSDSCGL